jgi:Cupin-like domain
MHSTTPPLAAASNEAPRKESSASEATPVCRVDDEWRRWIAENLLLEMPPDSILHAMVVAHVPEEEAARELDLAMQSPYLKGSARLRDRLRKRDWLLATYRKCNRLLPSTSQIERRHRLTRGEFLADYYSTGRAVVITGMMDDWPALSTWNLDYFEAAFGDKEIELSAGRSAGTDYEIKREKYIQAMKFSDFIVKTRSAGRTNDFYLTANNNSRNKQVLAGLWQDIVQIPEYLTANDPLGGFLWIGPAGTITPFHHDLTNNFMAQVVGRKRVLVVPSWDAPLMQNDYHVYSKIDGRALAAAPGPAADSPQVLECVIGPGDILFLPIGCFHFVEGLDVSVTVSFTNFVFDNDFSTFYTTYHEV